MNTYAAHLNNNNLVIGVIVGTSSWAAEYLGGIWVDVTDDTEYPGIGWTWDGTVFVPPYIPEEEIL